MSPKKHSASNRIISAALTGLLILGAILVYLNRQYVIDEINYIQYKPSSQIEQFASQSSMSKEGKFLFYASRPSVNDAANFTAACGSSTSNTAILGCYTGQKIYIYNITNAQLNGIMPVTAAYEMLHAAYQRLSTRDHTKVDALIEAEYKTIESNSSISGRVAYFGTTEPGQRDNELFSIIATEEASISPQLESYYSRYFTNRQSLVALHNKYSSVFNQLSTQEQKLTTQLTALASTIQVQTNDYNQATAQLNSDIDSYNSEATSGGFNSQAEADTQRAALMQRTTTLASQRDAINADIDTYNQLRAQLQAIDTQATTLDQSINSSLAPAPRL